MGSKSYKCNQCDRSFSRKWNALRHNELKHANLAHITNNSIKTIKTNRVSYKVHNKYYDYKIKFNILRQVETELNDYKFGIYFSDSFTENPIDIKIIKIIDQLIRPFEELEDLLGPIGEKT